VLAVVAPREGSGTPMKIHCLPSWVHESMCYRKIKSGAHIELQVRIASSMKNPLIDAMKNIVYP